MENKPIDIKDKGIKLQIAEDEYILPLADQDGSLTLEELKKYLEEAFFGSKRKQDKKDRHIAMWRYCKTEGGYIKEDTSDPSTFHTCSDPSCETCSIYREQMEKSYFIAADHYFTEEKSTDNEEEE